MSRIAHTLAPISGALGVAFLTLAILLAPQHRLLAQGPQLECDGPTACPNEPDCLSLPCSGAATACPDTDNCNGCNCVEDAGGFGCECNT